MTQQTDFETGANDDHEAPSRRELVERAVKQWVDQLVDLTGRNRLLFYKTLKRGTLELTNAESVALASLLSGRKTPLSRLIRPTEEEPDRHTDAVRSARTIYRKARELFEERGIRTLFIAVGLVSWTTDTTTATPAAPLLMAPMALTPVGSGEIDYTLDLDGEWRVNDTLLHYLRQTFGVHVDADLVLDEIGHGEEWANRAGEALLKQLEGLPGAVVVDRTVVGTFQYTKLPMVHDLQEHVDLLVDSDLVAALAGDETARETLRVARVEVEPSAPDTIPPTDEFLVLDADSSQNYAINAAIAGESLVVQGPPGTGKSQTIANLIATLMARGRSVLFVAEKRAAIDAVIKRLDTVGLSESVMDLHGVITSRRELAQALAASLDAIRSAPAVDTSENDFALSSARSALVEHTGAVHRTREPFGLSLHEAYVRLAGVPEHARLGLRFDAAEMAVLDNDTARQAREALKEWADLTAPFRQGSTPWIDTRISTREAASEALRHATDVARVATTTAADLERAIAETGLPAPGTLADWTQVFDVFADIAAVVGVAEERMLDLPLEDLEWLASDLGPGRRGSIWRAWSWIFGRRYRAASRATREYWIADEKPNGRQLMELVDHAVAAKKGWSDVSGKGRPQLPTSFNASARELDDLLSRLQALGAFFVTDLTMSPLEGVPDWSRRLVADEAALFRLPRIAELESWLEEHHLEALTDAVGSGTLDGSLVEDAFNDAWLRSFVALATQRDPSLAAFDGALLDRRVREYIEADTAHIEDTPARIRRIIAERAVAARDSYREQDEMIRAQARKKRRHLPLRDLFSEASGVLTSLRPCWTMSPLLVAQVLPPRPVFDVVVFDEASQIRPADAVPALSRARQAVVAGDDRQLPPTTFFDTADDNDEDADDAGLASGFESILDVLGVLLRNRTLTWHYRSEDERLIAFSNHAYYGGGLTTFPSTAVDDPVRHVLVPHRPGVRVDTRSSDDEVRTVVDLMIDHARHRPQESLGVIAMGIYHANRIDAVLRQRLEGLADRHLDEFFSDSRGERTFVKNLERVQGDERDAIILTVGYTKQADGRLLYRFGPINNQGGERRLNVAVTRARRRMIVVSGFSYTDMDPSKLRTRGVQDLYKYLRYAETGARELTTVHDIPLNPFELSILRRLEAAGLQVEPQHGASGYRIDFAIVHPQKPGEFILAVEADGASYHNTPTARDRDRLRQQVLERLGWRFHRIWSTSWFRDPERETRAVLEAVEEALRRPAPDPRPDPPPVHRSATVGTARGPRPRVGPKRPIGEYTTGQLVAMVRWVESDGLLRTNDELLGEVIQELGFRRRGKRIVAAVQEAIARERSTSG